MRKDDLTVKIYEWQEGSKGFFYLPEGITLEYPIPNPLGIWDNIRELAKTRGYELIKGKPPTKFDEEK